MKTLEDLDQVREHFKKQWKAIQEKYPIKLDGSIKFGFKGEFVGISGSLVQIVKENPHVFAKDVKVQRVKDALKSDKNLSETEIKKMLAGVELNPECRIEVIWNDLDFKLIKELQIDPLVDQNLTPKGAASIRIVLGSIGE